MSKKHDTIKLNEYKGTHTTRIHVVNTTDFKIVADIFYDIDEFKIMILKQCPKCRGKGKYLPDILDPGCNCDYSKKCPDCNGTGGI